MNLFTEFIFMSSIIVVVVVAWKTNMNINQYEKIEIHQTDNSKLMRRGPYLGLQFWLQENSVDLCALSTIKRWQYICDHNSGNSRSSFIIFAIVVSRKEYFTYIWQKGPPHLNNVLTLPSENETSHFKTSRQNTNRCLHYQTSVTHTSTMNNIEMVTNQIL